MADFLLELLCEEIPARMQSAAISQLQEKLESGLREARLPHGAVRAFVTPRRLAILIKGMAQHQGDLTVERKGPRVGAPDKAIEGFCASAGVSRETLQERDGVYFAVSEQQGKPAPEALGTLIAEILSGFHWPKSMRWGAFESRWVRPLRGIICLLGGDVVPVCFGHLKAGRTTQGHRFMASGAIELSEPAAYESMLEGAFVIADASRRREMIRSGCAELAAREGLSVKEDAALLDEVTGLVEWPVPVMGEFSPDYLRLPPEVLVLEMRHHQKYFALLDKNGAVTNRFLTVANIEAADGGEKIRHGNARVLRARLEDGAFYWEQDRRKPLDVWALGLASMVFHKQLGDMAAKVSRITRLAEKIAVFVPRASITQVARAAALCKADLTTGMVGEFPELQGVMGRYYALDQGEAPEVADAIRDHYKPAGLEDDVPHAPVAVAIALADKFDSLCGLFAAGEIPTGSKDPFALRRAALGVIRIIRTHKLRLPLGLTLQTACVPFAAQAQGAQASEAVHRFLLDRLRVSLREEGGRHDVVEAALAQAQTIAGDDLMRLCALHDALSAFLVTPEGENLTAAYRRAANIVRKEEQRADAPYDGDYVYDLLVQEEERALAEALDALNTPLEEALEAEAYGDALSALAGLRSSLDRFFDQVTVNAEDAALRGNRLQLLAAVRGAAHRVADFSKLEG